MSKLSETDIVNSATPLETRLAGVHPRLYATEADIAFVRGKLMREPWAAFLRRVEAVAGQAARRGVPAPGADGDLRGVGDGLVHLAVAYRLTGKQAYLSAARDHLSRMAAHDDWTTSLQYGHWAHGVALAYDWLYAALDAPLRESVRQAVRRNTENVYAAWVNYVNATPTGYAWNHMAVVHAGLMAAGCAFWAEIDGAGRWLRLAMEKMRLMAEALGPDGASAEGLAYGQYHLEFLLKALLLTDQLLGVDHFAGCAFLQNYPRFMLYSTLPRCAWVAGSPENRWQALAFMHLGDNDGCHWCGPDTQLRVVARRYRDAYAQGLAEATTAAGVNGDASCFLNLFQHDESVAPKDPDDLPTLRHFTDKDIVVLRSGWDDQAAVMAVKCGPGSGYHAARHYRHNIGGGHMHPDAGHIILHAAGDWLLIDDGYTRKATSYQNTALINGIGQTGEGADWFEDLEMRRGKAEGRIVLAQPGAEIDRVIADAAPAYEPAARLQRFYRHVLYVKPDVWVVVDEFEAEAPSTFELRFHVPRAVEPAGEAAWSMRGDRGALRVWVLGPTPAVARPFRDAVRAVAGHGGREIQALTVSNLAPASAAFFVTVLHAHPAPGEPRLTPRLESAGDAFRLILPHPDRREVGLHLQPGQSDPRDTIRL